MNPNQILRTKREDGIIISTINPSFMAWHGKYETGITFDNQESWHIAEGYETEEDAIKGHEKYANMSEDELSRIVWIG